ALAATVFGTAGPGLHSAATSGPTGVPTRPGHEGPSHGGTGASETGSSGATPGPGTAGGSGSGVASVLPIAFLGAPASGSAGGQAPGSSGSSNPGPPPGPTPGPPSPPPSSSGGGLLGLVSTLTGGIPVVGGSTGVVGSLTQLLTGAPTTTAAAVG
ncbi:MAG TPA: hypothetical protein VMU09_05765, partial [Acidimicrobiales bacterium]|nr:hypothetical protein [Acidimicrobiales bacterium]